MCTEIFYSQDGLDWIDYSLDVIRQNYEYLLQRIHGTALLVSELEAAYIITINFDGCLKFIERWHRQQQQKHTDGRHMVISYLRQQGIRGI
jgi:bifunctional pyridoxal-dependent enzyme with beta-cystathionase and maltose regulon repressor activities